MRYSFLLVLALFSISVVAQNNSARPLQKSDDYVAKLSAPAEEVQVQLSNGESVRDHLEREGVHLRPGQSVSVDDGTERQCLTMHSIVVLQPRKDSDQVQTRGERTCTMASKFKFKSAAPDEK